MFLKLKNTLYAKRYYILLIILSIIPLFSIFSTSKLLHTHDGLVHLARLSAYFKALRDGQLPVRWAGDLNYGYGMPIFEYIYHLPYFVGSIFLFLGFSLVNAFKISLSLSYVLSGIFMFAFAKSFFQDNKKALLVTVFYQFAPFRFVELIIRGSYGEVYTYTFIPLVLYGLTGLFKSSLRTKTKLGKIKVNENKIKYFYISVIGVSLLILSHNALSLVFFCISVLFAVIFVPNKKNLLVGFSSLILGIMLSSFYWIPALLEHKYTYGDLFMKNVYMNHFAPIQNFFIPNFFNSKNLQTEGISVQIGIFHVIALILGIWFLIYYFIKRKYSIVRILIFSYLIFFSALFLMSTQSLVLWKNVSLLRQFQFPWRLLGVTVLATSILSVYLLYLPIIKNKFVYIILILGVVFSTYHYWIPALYDTINEKEYWDYPLNTTYYGETDLIWSGGPATGYPKSQVDVIGGKAKITNIYKKSNYHSYSINADTEAQLVDHTQYFPGWKVYVDSNQVPVQFQDQNWRGQITYYVPKGIHTIRVIFGENILRFIADTLSLISGIFLFLFWFFRKKLFA